jgi:hypothetical protein
MLQYENIGFKVKYMSKDNIEKERQACNVYTDSEFIVHTHPLSEHPYPSIEDIWMLVNHTNIKLSVIATSWGIYTLKQKEEFKNNDWLKAVENRNYVEGFKVWLGGELDFIGMIEYKKKEKEKKEKEKKKEKNNDENKDEINYKLTFVEYRDINLILNNISNKMDIEIRLYPWNFIIFSPT